MLEEIRLVCGKPEWCRHGNGKQELRIPEAVRRWRGRGEAVTGASAPLAVGRDNRSMLVLFPQPRAAYSAWKLWPVQNTTHLVKIQIFKSHRGRISALRHREAKSLGLF